MISTQLPSHPTSPPFRSSETDTRSPLSGNFLFSDFHDPSPPPPYPRRQPSRSWTPPPPGFHYIINPSGDRELEHSPPSSPPPAPLPHRPRRRRRFRRAAYQSEPTHGIFDNQVGPFLDDIHTPPPAPLGWNDPPNEALTPRTSLDRSAADTDLYTDLYSPSIFTSILIVTVYILARLYFTD